jgi:hypothetical protein
MAMAKAMLSVHRMDGIFFCLFHHTDFYIWYSKHPNLPKEKR